MVRIIKFYTVSEVEGTGSREGERQVRLPFSVVVLFYLFEEDMSWGAWAVSGFDCGIFIEFRASIPSFDLPFVFLRRASFL